VARKIEVEVVGDTAAFERAMGRASAQSRQFGASFGKAESAMARFAKRAALTAGAAGVGALVIGSKKAIDAASNLNESINAVNVTFGKASKQITDFGKTAAATTGLSARQVNESATILGSALQNIGYSADQAAKQTITLTQRAADMASVFNTDVDQALGAIQAALRGESDPIERFGVGLNEAAVAAKALELGLAETTKEISAQDKAQARLALIMEQTDKVAGDFANTSDGAANQQRILRAEVENLQAQLGQKLLPIVQKVLAQVLEWTTALSENEELQRDVEEVVRDVVDVAKTMATTAQDVAEAVGGWDEALRLLLSIGLVAKMKTWTTAMGVFMGTSAAAGATAGGTGVLGAAGASSRLLTALRSLAKIGIITIGIQLALDKELQQDFAQSKVGKWMKSFFDLQIRINDALGLTNVGGRRRDTSGGAAVVPGVGVVGATDALTSGGRGGVQLPTGIKSTHPTSGLAGFPAVDIFAKPGTPVRAPEDGFITRIQGSATTQGGTYGWGLYFLGSKTGNTYFIKHLASTAPPGRYKKGAVIGTVSAWSGGASHVHLGIHAGASPVARGGGGGAGGPSDDPAAKKVAAKTFDAIPKALQLALASAELTKPTADDERVLRKIRANLQTQLRSKGLKDEDRITVLNALKSVNREIESIEDKHAEKLREKARKKRDAMLSAFKGVAAVALKEFDKATAAGLGVFDELTPAEKELAAFRQQRDQEQRAQRRAEASAIEDPFERAEALRRLDLEDQEAALEERARLEREARDKEREAYEEKRDEDRNRLEVWLEQQEKALEAGKKSWDKFYKDLRAIAIRYGFPVGPVGRAPQATPQAARAATSGILPGIASAAGGHVLDAGPDAGEAYRVVNVYVAGSVQAEQDLATTIRDTLARNGVRNDGTGL
jgi:murein DD-endopeptidase MepM/ murein hydrolase activator NlpD